MKKRSSTQSRGRRFPGKPPDPCVTQQPLLVCFIIENPERVKTAPDEARLHIVIHMPIEREHEFRNSFESGFLGSLLLPQREAAAALSTPRNPRYTYNDVPMSMDRITRFIRISKASGAIHSIALQFC